ncbi:MAG: TolC family protein [Ginsengibacter sp.]
MSHLVILLSKPICKILVLVIILSFGKVSAQKTQLTLDEAYQLSRKNYPVTRQKDLIRQTEQLNIENLNTAFLPQVNFNGQVSYQSDVTRVNISLPGIKVPSQTKDQYRATADVNQLIFDGGVTREQKKMELLNSAAEGSNVEVELYALKNRVNQLYFNILYQDKLLKQAELLLKDIQLGINKVKPQVENGTVLRSNLQILQAQYLQTAQRVIEISHTRKGLTDALSLLINQPVTENTELQIPLFQSAIDTTLNRREVKFYEDQSRLIAGREKLTDAKNLPKASAFIQGGYGKPGLNMLSNKFDPFYIAGLRLNWAIGGLYNAKRDKQLINISRQRVSIQKETFVLNTLSNLEQQGAEISRYADLVSSDKAIIEIRNKISEAAKAQLENAVISANDYLREINAEDQARQAMATHSLQLLQAQINYQIISGKL